MILSLVRNSGSLDDDMSASGFGRGPRPTIGFLKVGEAFYDDFAADITISRLITVRKSNKWYPIGNSSCGQQVDSIFQLPYLERGKDYSFSGTQKICRLGVKCGDPSSKNSRAMGTLALHSRFPVIATRIQKNTYRNLGNSLKSHPTVRISRV